MVRQWLLAVVVLLFVGQVGAVEYYWIDSRNYASSSPPTFKSAYEACLGSAEPSWLTRPLLPFPEGSTTSVGCRFQTGNSYFSPFSVTRRGSSCENGRVYNTTVLGCQCPEGQEEDAGGICAEPPSCDAGLELLTRGSNFPASIVSGRVYVLSSPPSAVCSAGCQYISTSSKANSCYLLSGSADTGFCNYTMTSDGGRCSSEDAPGPDVGDPPNPDDSSDTPNQPSDPDDPGCPDGQSWSGSACTKDPADDEGGDGGGADDGDDKPGDPCDIEGDCWDEDDGSGGSGNGSGNGSGSGSGNGDGSGDDDGDGDDDGRCDPSKGYICNGGDGPDGHLSAPEAGSWDKANQEWDQRLDDSKKELKEKVKTNVDKMKSAFDLQLSAGGGELPCDSISVWGKSYRFCVADYGSQLANLRLALLLMAAVVAALIVLKE